MNERSLHKALDLAEIYKEARLVASDEQLLDVLLQMYPELGAEALRRGLVERGLVRDESTTDVAGTHVEDEKTAIDAVLNLFEPIVGYEDVKDLLLRAIDARRPVHVLLEGPPASAKTLFLMELGTLPGSHFALGGTATKAGLTDLLLLYRPRFLIVDEIETIDDPRDYAALLHLMENQEVIETKFRRHRRVPLTTWVFGAGNDVSRLPRALVSRFGGTRGIIRFREYTREEFSKVATSVLVAREGFPEDFAVLAAESTLSLGSRDVRTAVWLARLARDPEGLAKVVDTLRRRR